MPKSLSQFREWCKQINQRILERTPLQTDYDPVDLTVKGFRYKPNKSFIGGGANVQQMIVKGFAADWLLCLKYDESGQQPAEGVATAADYIKVAKPYELQFTPWDFVANGGLEIDTIKFVYATASKNWSRRKASRAGIIEMQIIVRPFYLGEIIYAENKVGGGVGVLDDITDPTKPVALEWIDTNNAGRGWAQTDISDPIDATL